MERYRVIGKSVKRKEGADKVTGRAKYINDEIEVGTLYAKLLTSPYAHAYIRSIDIREARKVQGVHVVVTGADYPILVGSSIVDRPPLAFEKVRYFGEPVALVVADDEAIAIEATARIRVMYEELPIIRSPLQAYNETNILVHEHVEQYKLVEKVYPKPHTNIANRTKIRKGDIQNGFANSDVIACETFSFRQSDHAAMETRCARVEIKPSGDVIVHSTSQAPFEIKRQLSEAFEIDEGKVIVHVPLVGGAYGGKTAVQLEFLAYIASKAVGGRRVTLRNSREEDFITSPVHIGLQAKVKLGCTKEGKLQAAEFLYLFDGGAYADRAVTMSKAAGLDCTGPYAIENVWCDSLGMYTNHTYATSFRGFGHSEYTFVIERTIDILAEKLGMCPLMFRLLNAIRPGDTTPTQVLVTPSNTGDIAACLQKLKLLINWEEGKKVVLSNGIVRAKGVSCFWKNSTTPRNAGAGAVLTFNGDGSANINCGAVEIGQETKTVLTQMVAEKMNMSTDDVHIMMEVNTQVAPKHWKTAASRTTHLVGNAVVIAAEDAMRQLCQTASNILGYPIEELDVAGKEVYVKANPNIHVPFSKIALGYVDSNGHVKGAEVVGRGSYVFEGITDIDYETGKGRQGPEWGVGAQAVEVEYNPKDFTYRLLNAVTVADAGTILNRKGAETQIMGAMSMGLSFATRETFHYDAKERNLNHQFRTYKVIHYGQQPKYIVDFVEVPHKEAAFGSRGLGEHGIIGMPAALGNSLSIAANLPLRNLPLTPELIWKESQKRKGWNDTI
ncbi:xanthine dehydrogenase family protein molybdopterin-binding subunit [Bacillus cytotoxicus]|uniref:Xanthine dehydrogenase family protein molybdopterin-binding subunit n=1 Tax=Bacillus cytotoxicus TaxID=580165 RepID=A0ACC6ACJ2_9BACI|nr:xanthine dehydrogenase family protein molybdopterin-binding subunit [Bacillus cytotoxicus]